MHHPLGRAPQSPPDKQRVLAAASRRSERGDGSCRLGCIGNSLLRLLAGQVPCTITQPPRQRLREHFHARYRSHCTRYIETFAQPASRGRPRPDPLPSGCVSSCRHLVELRSTLTRCGPLKVGSRATRTAKNSTTHTERTKYIVNVPRTLAGQCWNRFRTTVTHKSQALWVALAALKRTHTTHWPF